VTTIKPSKTAYKNNTGSILLKRVKVYCRTGSLELCILVREICVFVHCHLAIVYKEPFLFCTALENFRFIASIFVRRLYCRCCI
jgi:hypothetical protein